MIKDKKVPELRFPGFTGEWEEKKLGEVLIKTYNGQTPSRLKKEYWNGNINWLSSGELNRSIVMDTIEKITDKGREKANLKIVPKGTFIISITGLEAERTRGNCAILGVDTTINQSCMALFPKINRMSSEFLFYWYIKYGKIYGVKYTQGTKQQSYNSRIINILPIKIPSLAEQEKIGSFFYTLDKKLDLQKKKIEELKTYKKGVMQRVFDQEIRFKGENGQDYPDWEEKRLGELGEFLSSSVNKKIKRNEEIVNLYNYMDVYNKISINNNNLYKLSVTSATKTQIENNNLLKGDILITPSSETPEDIGHSVVIKEHLQKTVYSYHLIRFRPKITTDILFSNYWFNNENVRKEFIVRSQGATRFTLSINNIKKVKVQYPCKAEQEKIGLILSAIDKKIELEKEMLELYEELKKGLLQRMFV